MSKPLGAILVIAGFTLWAHVGSTVKVSRGSSVTEPDWQTFRVVYQVDDFGEDGHFVRAVRNGYNVFYSTARYAARFTRKTSTDHINACASCHIPEDMAYGFVNADRFDAKLGRRVSYEERVMRCFAGPMQGYVPTLYDPAVRDLRIFARAVSHHLQLSEGALRNGR